jgi:peptidoglycan/xylan/chitin deacetylase (PgdA/CDA1 family)
MLRTLKKAAYLSGCFRAALALRRSRGVCVLGYHAVRSTETAPPDMAFSGLHVPATRLEEELAAIRRLGTPVSARLLRQALRGDVAAPPRAVHVTFDDGYRSVLTRALPLLEKHDVPASVFVCTRPVERGQLQWYDAAARGAGEEEVERVRRGSAREWQSARDRWCQPAPPGDELQLLSPGDVAALARHPLIEIGGHSESHPRLAALDEDGQRAEIAGSLVAIESWTGRRPTSFAYPTGRPGDDYDARTVALVREAGVDLAFTTVHAWAGPARPALEQPRFVMADGVDGVELAYRLAWGWPR